MFKRRTIAYIVDTLIYIGTIIVALFLGGMGPNTFISVPLQIILSLFLLFIIFGIISVLLKGSIGKKIVDLRIVPTIGLMTPFRFWIRDGIVKYSVYFPMCLAIYFYIFANRAELAATIYLLSNTSLLALGIFTLINLFFLAKDKKVLLDVFFCTKVENDIPTAHEYADIDKFLSEQ